MYQFIKASDVVHAALPWNKEGTPEEHAQFFFWKSNKRSAEWYVFISYIASGTWAKQEVTSCIRVSMEHW